MDEPTAALAVAEAVFGGMFSSRLMQEGKSVILISHNIQDVFAVSDRITVMRHGRCIAVRQTPDTDPEDIIGLITGAAQMRTADRPRARVQANP